MGWIKLSVGRLNHIFSDSKIFVTIGIEWLVSRILGVCKSTLRLEVAERLGRLLDESFGVNGRRHSQRFLSAWWNCHSWGMDGLDQAIDGKTSLCSCQLHTMSLVAKG
jgi:hypothetical protein